MAVLNSLQDFAKEDSSDILAKDSILLNMLVEIQVSLGFFHDNVEIVRVLEVVKHLNHVLVLEQMQKDYFLRDQSTADLLEYTG